MEQNEFLDKFELKNDYLDKITGGTLFKIICKVCGEDDWEVLDQDDKTGYLKLRCMKCGEIIEVIIKES